MLFFVYSFVSTQEKKKEIKMNKKTKNLHPLQLILKLIGESFLGFCIFLVCFFLSFFLFISNYFCLFFMEKAINLIENCDCLSFIFVCLWSVLFVCACIASEREPKHGESVMIKQNCIHRKKIDFLLPFFVLFSLKFCMFCILN